MDHGVYKKGQPFLFAVFCKETKSEICIGVTNDLIVESQLLGSNELNEGKFRLYAW